MEQLMVTLVKYGVSDMAVPPPQEAVGWMRRNYTTLTTPGRRLVTGA